MTEYLNQTFDWTNPGLVAVYDELPLWSAMFGRLLLEHVPLQENINVLDLGCGTGFPMLDLAQRLGASSRVYGLDLWRSALGRLRGKIRIWHIQNVVPIAGDGAAMPLQAGQIDLVVSNLGLNNFADPLQTLRECQRVTRAGARLVLTTNLSGHMQEFYNIYEATLQELGRSDALRRLPEHIAHRGTLESVGDLLGQAGFNLDRVLLDNFSMRFLDGSSLLRHAFIRLGFLDGWRGVLDGQGENEVFTRLEANLNLAARSVGELSLTIPMAYIEARKE